jgi:hypothetical protein
MAWRGRAEDFDPEALAGGGVAHVRGCRRGQLTCLGGLAAGGDVALELPVVITGPSATRHGCRHHAGVAPPPVSQQPEPSGETGTPGPAPHQGVIVLGQAA